MDAADAVDELRDAQVDDDAREREASRDARHRARGPSAPACPSTASAAASSRSSSKPNAIHASARQRDRPFGRRARRASDSVSCTRSAGHSIASCADLAVALPRVAVAGREERAVDGDRQEERRAGDELGAVDVPALRPRRRGRVTPALLGRRHADHAEERPQVDLAAARPAHARTVELVDEEHGLALRKPSRSLSGSRSRRHREPVAADRTSSIRTASVCPARAPRTSIGPTSACPRVELSSRGSNSSPDAAARAPAGVRASRCATESPESIVSTGSRSREKCPCSVRRSSGISWSHLEREQLPHGVGDTRHRGHVRVLELPVRVGDVVAGHAEDRPAQVEDRLLRQDRGDLGRVAARARAPPGRRRRGRSSPPRRAARPRRAASACAGRAPRRSPPRPARPRPARPAAPSRRRRRPSRRRPRARHARVRAGRRARRPGRRRASSGSGASARRSRPGPGSRIAAASRPLASAGVAGIATFTPGVCT